MNTFKFFSIAFILCVCVFSAVKAEHYTGLSVSTWNHDISSSLSVLNTGDLLQNFSDGNLDIEEGCRCENGICVKQCVKEKNGVCRRTANVCVCDPEFVKINDETCIYCDCGKGFNCTFYHVTRTCVCPEGFYIRDDKCAAKCSESRPCQNGGKCNEGKCQCKVGTSGTYCESSDWCSTKCNQNLLTECVYDKEKEEFSCLCLNRSLVYDFQNRVCKPCSCGAGKCIYKSEKMCLCDPGYLEFKGQCRQCDCGRGGICELTERGEKTCTCEDGDFSRERKCLPCDCGLKDAKCETNKDGRKVCICPYGYEDILGKCIKMNKDDRRCLCHPTANCIETSHDDFNEFNCTCNEGYKGKIHDIPHVGEECIDIDECLYSKSCPDRQTTKCVNFAGSYMCRCKIGYQPIDMNADPRKTACVKYKISWAPTGIVIGIIISFIAISVGVLFYLKKRSNVFLATPGIEMGHADYK